MNAFIRTTLPVHPTTGLAALAVHPRTGRPVWPILGGSTPTLEGGQQTTGPAGGQDAQQQNGQQATQGTQQGAQGQQAPPAEPEGPRDGEDAAAFLARVGPDGAAKLALRYRAEAGDQRQAKKTAEDQATKAAADAQAKLLDQLRPTLVTLGVIKDDAKPDADKLADDLRAANQATAAQQAAAKALTVENAVLRAAGPLGVNADRLLDSRKFSDTVNALDPTADDFGAKIRAAIQDAVKNDNTLKVVRAATRAGLQNLGGSGSAGTSRVPLSLEDALNAQT